MVICRAISPGMLFAVNNVELLQKAFAKLQLSQFSRLSHSDATFASSK